MATVKKAKSEDPEVVEQPEVVEAPKAEAKKEPSLPSDRAGCAAAMEAKHAEIAKIEGWLAQRKAELDALIQLHNRLPK